MLAKFTFTFSLSYRNYMGQRCIFGASQTSVVEIFGGNSFFKKRAPLYTKAATRGILIVKCVLRYFAKGSPVNFAKFLRTPFLQNKSGLLLFVYSDRVLNTPLGT